MKWLTIIALFALIVSCENTTKKNVITFWHFWSEPAQRSALQSLISQYEAQHPDVSIKLTELAWSDGQSKLQLAFNAGNQPDIVHIGMDWFAEFESANLFAPIDAPVPYGPYGALWVVNTRALLQVDTGMPTYTWGLCANDAHNVIKRTLPLLWKYGASDFYTRLPISHSMDSTLVQALWSVRGLASDHALLEQGRQLDQAFMQGKVANLYSGAWMLGQSTPTNRISFSVVPTRSVLNGDVLAVSKSSARLEQAAELVKWLTAYPQAREFCVAVPDAGIPADPKVFDDTTFARTEQQRGFLQTIHGAKPLPRSPLLLRFEPIVESLIERSYRAENIEQVKQYVQTARVEIQSIESK